VSDDLGIAGVRGLTAENGRGQTIAAQLLVHQAELQLTITLTTKFWTQVTGPEALILDLLLKGPDEFIPAQGPMHRHAQMAERLDLVAHEVLNPVQLLLKFWIGFKVPCHGQASLNRRCFAA